MTFLRNNEDPIETLGFSEYILSRCAFNNKTTNKKTIKIIKDSLDEFQRIKPRRSSMWTSLQTGTGQLDSITICPSAIYSDIHYLTVIHDDGYKVNIFIIRDFDNVAEESSIDLRIRTPESGSDEARFLECRFGEAGFRVGNLGSFQELQSGIWTNINSKQDVPTRYSFSVEVNEQLEVLDSTFDEGEDIGP